VNAVEQNSVDGNEKPVPAATPLEQAQRLRDAPEVPLLVEFFQFLRDNRKWWLAPIIVILMAMTAVAALTSSAAAPFIYTLF